MPLWHSVPRRLTERCRTRLTASPPQLFFAKVAPSAPANEVARVFEPFGGVEEINLFRAWPTARSSKGCGLVTMTSHEGARAARAALNGRRAWEGADAPMAVEWCAPGKLGVRAAAGKAAGGGRRAPRQSASFSGPAGAGRHRVPQHSASFTGPVGGGRAVGPTSPAAAPAAESTVAAARQFQLQALAAANAGQMQPQLWLEATAMAPAVAPAAPLPGSLRPPSAGCHTLRPLPAPPAPAHLLLAQLGGNAGAGPPAGVAAGRRGLWDAAALPAFTMREPAGSLTGSSALLDPGTFPGTPAGCGAAAGAASLGGRLSDFLIAASVEHAVNSRAAALTAAVAASQISDLAHLWTPPSAQGAPLTSTIGHCWPAHAAPTAWPAASLPHRAACSIGCGRPGQLLLGTGPLAPRAASLAAALATPAGEAAWFDSCALGGAEFATSRQLLAAAATAAAAAASLQPQACLPHASLPYVAQQARALSLSTPFAAHAAGPCCAIGAVAGGSGRGGPGIGYRHAS
ncbi:RNA-binding protein [Monoraphidium neglectum]|uniref:RNA-binding protein n=1 Tax=Monoraphidium neglectum TaxID=145388 RepID=A0A0D2JU60_9CHLO|nr:RNA-binding protein [Monoraphidium neglectum]KIZ02443.1 RNA-binding protein [Monoraphidium neglectum]|eukprot:XP_013901462.1 RNA-binding protein [Monoraphidium neglectum]